ncbi:Putative cytosolic protein, partial (plasmid) [Borrelia nietonii YOR]
MKRSILSVCMLTLLCLLSCDINALNELLDKSRENFVEENKKLKDLKSIKGNQEIKEEQVDIVVKSEEGVKINQKNLQEKGIEIELKGERPKERVGQQQSISQDNRLTEEEESYLVSYDNEVNEINSKVSSKLVTIEAMHSEVSASLSEIESMQANIIKANSDFDRARGSNGNGIDQNVKIKLHQAIEKVRISRNIAMMWYKEQFNVLKNAKSYAEH